jgi:hypothetical protein
MFNVKSRIAIAAVSVAAVATGATSAASAAMIQRAPGTTAPVVVKAQTSVALTAGSAGIPGYDDAKCESLVNDYNTAVDRSEQGLLDNDTATQNTYGELANRIYGQLTDNCLVID